MHELSLCRGLIDSTLAIIEEHRVSGRVSAVLVQVGRFTTVVPESLRFHFEVLRRGTRLEDAELQVETVPLRTRCTSCGIEHEPEVPSLLCRDCDGLLEIVAGRELRVVAIDVTEDAA